MKFLSEKDVVPALQSMLASSDIATLVVAFWGKGAVDRLGLTARRWKDLTVVCNLFSGACNPAEICYLRDNVSNLRLRKSSTLHGKVYMTPEKVILGSSNASTNGLVVEGDRVTGWSEANVETDDPGMLRSCADWCEIQFDASSEITESDILSAEILWDARKTIISKVTQETDLFAACRADPEAFGLVDVVLWKEGLTAAGRGRLQNLKNGNDDIYEGWGDRLVEEHWALDVSLEGEKPSFTGIFQIGETTAKGFTLVTRKQHIKMHGRPALTLSDRDKALLAGNAKNLFSKYNKNGVVIPLAQAIAEIDRLG